MAMWAAIYDWSILGILAVSGGLYVQLKAESSGQSQQGTHLLPGGRGDVAAAPAVEAGQRGQA